MLQWAVKCLAKAGTLSIVGLSDLVDLIESGVIDPADVLTQTEPLTDAIEAYKAFDLRQPGWVKVELKPTAKERKAA